MLAKKNYLKKWIANIDFDEELLVSKQLNTKFALKYIIYNSAIPVNVKFSSKDFVRPPNLTQ